MNPIPTSFFSDNSDDTTNCIICKQDNTAHNSPYIIEKGVKNFPELKAKQTIFQYSICMDCASKTREGLSKDSLNKMDAFIQSLSATEHHKQINLLGFNNKGDATQKCFVTGKDIDLTHEYQLVAYCKNNALLQHTYAFMISDEGLETIYNLLSEETKDELDRFKDNIIGVPPEWEDLINPKNLLLL